MLRALGRRIRELRDAKRWSQERLAEAAYVDRSYLAGIERGLRNPSVRNLLKIAGALKVRMAELFRDCWPRAYAHSPSFPAEFSRNKLPSRM